MITLPSSPAPSSVTPELIDFGLFQRPATGAKVTRIDRAGSRYRLEVGFPPMQADTARVFISRLLKAKSEGLRLTWPLLGVSQGTPGSPVVNGSGAAGTSLPLRGLTPGYTVKEGYWLTVVDGSGNRYLHNVGANVTANGSGVATVTVTPMLRAALADGATVLLAEPTVDGLVTEVFRWPLPTSRLIEIAFSMEEAA